MNNRTYINEYKSIKAPAELKNRVLDSVSTTKKKSVFSYTKTLSLVAACLMLFACIGFIQLFNNPIIVSVEPISVATVARDSDSFVAIIKIEHKGTIEIDSKSGFSHVDECGNVYKTALEGFRTEDCVFLGWKGNEQENIFSVNGVEYKINFSENGVITVEKNK